MAEQLEQATGRTIADMATVAGERYGEKTAIRHRDGDDWAEQSFAEVAAIVMEGEADGAITLEDLREKGKGADHAGEITSRREKVGEDDAYTIIYTSGTTGNPKGVVLTHTNAGSVGALVRELDFVSEDDV